MDSDAIAAGIWKFLWQLASVMLAVVLFGSAVYAVFIGLLMLYATGNLPMLILVPIIGVPLFKVARWLWHVVNMPAKRREFREFWTGNEFSYDDSKPLLNAHGIRYPFGPLCAGYEIMQVVERAFQGVESKDEVEEVMRICVGMLHHPKRKLSPDAGSMRIALGKFLQREAVTAFDAAQELAAAAAANTPEARKRAEFAKALAAAEVAAASAPLDPATAQEQLNLAADMLQAARGTEAEVACQKNHIEKLAALYVASRT
ncbi:hypothetical protein [Bradyrhizobium guangdongense]